MRRLASVLFAACVLPSVPWAASTTKFLGQSVTVVQSVTGIDALSVQSKATLGSVDFSQAAGLRSQVMSTEVPNAGGIVSIPALLYGDGTRTPGEIKNLATADMRGRASSVAAALKIWMNANGIGSGAFVFEQEIKPKNAAHKMKLVWQVLVTDAGRAIYGDPRLVDGDPTVVYIVYVPKAVDSGLPSSWAYPDAGQLKWQLRAQDGTPVTSWTILDTAGAFDEPTGTNVDPDIGLRCIVDKTADPSCPTGFVDAKGLVADTGSLGAIVDYVRKVQPVYDEVSDPDHPGEVMYQPRMSLSYDTRALDAAGCGSNSYRNAGRYGFTLSTIVDRYFFDAAVGVPYQVNRFTGTSVSPTQNFDITQATPYRSVILQGMAFNPIDPGNPLVAVSTLPGVIYMAPITVTATPSIAVVGASIPYTVAQNGAVFTINVDQRNPQNWGAYEYYIDVNAPRGNIDWARISRNQADDGDIIFVNGVAVSATANPPAYSYTQGPRPLYSWLPLIASTVQGVGTPYNGDGDPYWMASSQTYQTTICLQWASEDYCARTGTATANDRIAIVGPLNYGDSVDPNLPRTFENQLNNGVTRLLVQYFDSNGGATKISFDFKTCDY